MNSYLTVENNFSIQFDAPKEMTKDFIINLIKENVVYLNNFQLPKFELRLKKSYKNFDTKFASGQININTDFHKSNDIYITYLNSFKNPKWWKENNPSYIKGVLYFDDRIKLT